MFEIVVNILLTILGFILGVLVTNIVWRSRVDDISRRLLETTDEQMKRAYEKDDFIRRNNHENY
nr:MAG TPA: Protein of unknown function (DUF1043) [Bacteriophage sp.]